MSGARRAAGVVLGVGPDDLDTVLRGQAGFRSGVGLGVAVEVAQADVPALVDQILILGLGLLGGLALAQVPGQTVLGGLARLELAGTFGLRVDLGTDRKSTRLNSSHVATSYAAFRLKKK